MRIYFSVQETLECKIKNRQGLHVFVYPNITFFVEGLLDVMQANYKYFVLKSAFIDKWPVVPEFGALQAAMFHNFGKIFQLLTDLLVRQDNRSLFNPEDHFDLLHSAIKHSNVEVINICCNFLQHFTPSSIWNIKLPDMRTPLHLAAQRGNYMIYKFVASRCNQDLENPETLLQSCIRSSHNDNEQVISEKLEIMNDIVLTNEYKLIYKELTSSSSSKCQVQVHFKITEFLLNLKICPTIFTLDGYTILNHAAETYNPTQFNKTCHILANNGFSGIFKSDFESTNTAFVTALVSNKLLPETFDHFMKSRSALEIEHLLLAIVGFQDIPIMKSILEFFSIELLDSHHIVHFAARKGNFESLRLLTTMGCSVNNRSSNGNTALHEVIQRGQNNITETVETLLNENICVNALDEKGRTALSYIESCNDPGRVDKNVAGLLRRVSTASKLKHFEKQTYVLLQNCARAGLPADLDFKLLRDICSTDSLGRTPIHWSCIKENVEALKYFVSVGAEINIKDRTTSTPFHYLAQAKTHFIEMLEILIQNGGNINETKKDGCNLLIALILNEASVKQLDSVVTFGGNWRTKLSDGTGVFHLAVQTGNCEALRLFIQLAGNLSESQPKEKHSVSCRSSLEVLINDTDHLGRTPIQLLANTKKNFVSILHILVDNGADINSIDIQGNNLLFNSALCGRSRTDLEEVLKLGGNMRQRNSIGDNILAVSAQGGNYASLEMFLSLGVDIYERNEDHKAPFHRLAEAQSNFRECLFIMLKHGADINATDRTGKNLVLDAVINGKGRKDLQLLVDNKCNWELRDNTGQSVLHLAVQAGNFEALDIFLAKGLDVETKDHLGRTPLLLFENTKINQEEVLQTLFKYKADLDASNNKGQNLFQILIDREKSDSLMVLNNVLAEVL